MTPIMSTYIYSLFPFTENIKSGNEGVEPTRCKSHEIYSFANLRSCLITHTKRVCSVHHTLPYFLLVNTKMIHLIYPDNMHSSLTACKSLEMRLLYQANHLMNHKSSEFLLSSSRTLPETPACH